MIIDHKSVDLFGKRLFETMIVRPSPKMVVPVPMPNEACFIHIKKGNLNAVSDKQFIPVNQKQSVLMKCGSYVTQLLPDVNTGLYEAFAVHFYPDVMRKVYEDRVPNFLKSNKQSEQVHSSMVTLEVSYLIGRYVEDVQYYLMHPRLVNENILVHKLREILMLLIQTQDAPKILNIFKNLFTPRSVEFKQVIESHVFSDISLEEFALLLNMSLSTFKRHFKVIYGCAPSSYIRIKRLEKAKKMISFSDESISSIAYECGFKTVGHFSRKFKEAFGQSPSELRLK